MERKVVAVCVAVVSLGLLSAALAFAAEATRIKASDIEEIGQDRCRYPKSPALALGLLSSLALIVAQVIINTVAGCFCCTKHPRPSDNNWMVALICFIASWVSFVLAFLLLLAGAASNDQSTLERRYFDNGDCYVGKPGVFAGGAVSSFTSVALGIVYYVALSSKNAQTGEPGHCDGVSSGSSPGNSCFCA